MIRFQHKCSDCELNTISEFASGIQFFLFIMNITFIQSEVSNLFYLLTLVIDGIKNLARILSTYDKMWAS